MRRIKIPIRALSEQPVVLVQLVPVRELAVGSHLKAEERFRIGESWLALGLAGPGQGT
jgi:hypothetical protein